MEPLKISAHTTDNQDLLLTSDLFHCDQTSVFQNDDDFSQTKIEDIERLEEMLTGSFLHEKSLAYFCDSNEHNCAPQRDNSNESSFDLKLDLDQNTFQNDTAANHLDEPFIEHDEIEFECDECKKSFATYYGLNRHKLVHSNEKPFSCSYCKKTFRLHQHLKIHTRNHTGQDLFECQYCHKKFNVNSNLNNHIRIHTGEKPFKCEKCDKSFTFRAQLNFHARNKKCSLNI